MDGSGDGSHFGNHLGFPLPLHAAGDQPHGGIFVVLNFFYNRGLGQAAFAAMVDLWNNLEDEGADDGDIDEDPNNDEIEDNNEDQEDDHQEEDYHGNIGNNENHDINQHHNSLDNNDGIIDNNNEDAEVAGCSAWFEVGVNQGDEEDPLPGVSWKRSRKDYGEDIDERSSKNSRWWDKSTETSTDSDTDFKGYNKKTVNDPNSEEDSLPGPFKKRKRKTNRVEEEGSSKKSRQCSEFTESNSDAVTVTTGHDLPHSSGNIEVSEDAGAAGQTDTEEEEKDPCLGGSRKRSREDDEEEDLPDGKRFKR